MGQDFGLVNMLSVVSVEVMAQAKNASTLSVHLENWVIAELQRRAELLGWSKSQYAAHILTEWYKAGAPPVNASEEHTLIPLPRDAASGELGPITWVGAVNRKPGQPETTAISGRKVMFGAAKKAASSG